MFFPQGYATHPGTHLDVFDFKNKRFVFERKAIFRSGHDTDPRPPSGRLTETCNSHKQYTYPHRPIRRSERACLMKAFSRHKCELKSHLKNAACLKALVNVTSNALRQRSMMPGRSSCDGRHVSCRTRNATLCMCDQI